MKMPCLLRHTLTIGSVSLALAGTSVSAATRTKADNLDNLDQGTSWVGGVVPTSLDTALFDSTLTAANTSLLLGADTNWLGLSLTSPGAAVTLNSGNTLTLGASGIDMSTASQGLTLGCGITLATAQTWNVGTGVGSTNSGLLAGTGPLVKTGAGTLAINLSSNTYSGGTFLAGGTNVVGSVANGHFGTGSVTITNGATLLLFSGNSGDPGGGGGSFTNNLNIPTGQTATVLNMWRGTCSGPVTGGGTLNLRVNGVRGEWTANWSGFTGQVNVSTRSGTADDFRINVGGTTNATGFTNSVINLTGGAIMYQSANPPNGGVTASTTFQPIGALTGTTAGTLSGNLIAGRFVNWQIGFLNTDTTFPGRIADNTGGARITKVGTGTLTLTGTNTYSGSTTVLNGKLVEVTGGSASNSPATTLSPGTFGLLVGPNGPQWVGTNLVFGTSSTLEMNFGGSTPSPTTAPLLVRGNLALTSSVSVKILGGNWSAGAYPLVKFSSLTNGNGFAALNLTALPLRVGALLSNDTINSAIYLVVTNTTQPLRWATGNGTWDVGTTSNWVDAASAPTSFQQSGGFGDSVLFEDTVSVGNPITVTLNTTVTPAGATVNASKTYTLSGSGAISGLASLTKTGPGTLTVNLNNSFTGGANLNGGILNFSTLGNLGASGSPISFGGGTLQFASGNTSDISVRTVTLNAGNGTIDTAGNNLLFANPIGNNGTGGLTKTGAGTLTLSGANRYSGTTTVSQASLILASGASISNSVAIVVSSGTILDVTASGLILNGAVGQTVSGVGTINGSVTSAAGSALSPGASAGTITFGNDLNVSGGPLVMDVSTNAGGTDRIHVNGLLSLNSGSLQLVPATFLTNGNYRLFETPGGLAGTPGNLILTGFAQSGQIAFLSDAVAGEIDLVVATGGTNNLFWSGTSGSWDVGLSQAWLAGANPSVFNQGDTVTFDDSGSANSGVGLMSAIYPSNVTVGAAANYTFSDGSGSGKLIGPTRLSKGGAGTLTILTVNNNTGPAIVSNGVLQIGNGGTTGSLGNGNISNNAAVNFAQPDDRSVNGVISGTGQVVQQGSATLTLTKDNNYSGSTTISSGTLQVGAGGATGALGSGPVINAGNLIFNRAGTFTVANGIAGTGTPNPAQLIKLGAGTMTLGGVNTYEGNTYISNGVVKLGASEVIPDGGATTGWLILDGGPTFAGTLDLNGFNETVNSLSGLGGTALGRIVNNTGTATNTLTVNGTASTTFAGTIQDNTGTGGRVGLVVNGAGPLNLTGASTYSGGTIIKSGTLGLGSGGQAGTASISLSNGTSLNLTANNPSVFPGNDIITQPDGTVTFLCANLANGLAGNFFGNANCTNLIAASVSASTANFRQFSNFFGTVLIQDSFQLRFSSTTLSVNGGDNTRFVVGAGATLNTRNGTGVAAGSGIYLGELLGPGILGGAGNADGTSVYVIGGKGTDFTFDGTINGAAPRSTYITKVGAGTMTLTGVLSHEGPTVVSNGVLTITGSAVLDTSTNVVVRAGASLYVDPSGSAAGTLNLGNSFPQVLTGSGTVRGSVNAIAAGTVAPGDGIGTLTVTNTVTLAGALNMELNRTNTPATNDVLAAPSITAGGTLNVANVGPGLRSGDSFKLLSGPISGTFATVNLPAISPCLSWNTSSLYSAGTISVSGSLCPPTLSSSRSGTNLTLSWGAEYMNTGWILQQQTNAWNVGLTTNWTVVAGSGATNQLVLTISPTNGSAFYRLFYQ